MRGKEDRKLAPLDTARITPAYAGKSRFFLSVCVCRKDHPRVCGEKSLQQITKFSERGSPPRMRGKENTTEKTEKRARITPAYAGKSRSFLSVSVCRKDHPRVCGEKFLTSYQKRKVLGSPPRMRGKASPNCSLTIVLGITPAYAGKRHV